MLTADERYSSPGGGDLIDGASSVPILERVGTLVPDQATKENALDATIRPSQPIYNAVNGTTVNLPNYHVPLDRKALKRANQKERGPEPENEVSVLDKLKTPLMIAAAAGLLYYGAKRMRVI